MSGEVNGADVLVQINKGDELTPNWETVASQKGVTLNEARTTVDTSSKESADETHLAGRYSATLTLDTLFVPGAATFNELRYRMRNRLSVRLKTLLNGQALETALATITGLVMTAQDQQAVTANATFKISGGWEPASS
jgi:predicted secreted protein